MIYDNKRELTLAFSLCVSMAIHMSVLIISHQSTDINIVF